MSILFGLEIKADGAAQTIGEFKKLRGAIDDTTKTAKGTGDAIAKSNVNLGGGVQALAAKYFLVTQAIQALIGIAKPAYEALIGQNAQLQQQLIGTQSTLAATSDVFKDGVKIGDPTAAIQALEGPVNEAIAKIRKGSLELVGVTSKDLVEAFQIVAGKSGEIGISLDQAADLTLSFSAALGTLGIPLVQARQEIQSILTGTIDQNSVLAQSLGIKNEEIRQLKSQGKLYEALTNKLSAFRAGNKLSAQTIGGITSNIQELFDEITRQAGQPLLRPLVEGLDEVFQFLNKNKDAILAFVTEGIDSFLSLAESVGVTASELGDKLAPTVAQLSKIFDSDFGLALENVVNGLLRFSVLATDVLLNNPAVQIFLKVADAAVTAAAAITSLNGDLRRSTEAADTYRQQSAKVADEAIAALTKTKRGEADATAARTEAIAKIDDQIKALEESNLTGSENRSVIRSQITELETYKQKLKEGAGAIKLVSKDTKEQTKALEEKAKAEAAALKSQQDAAKEKSQEQVEQRSRDRADKAAEAQRNRQSQFDELQRTVDRRYQDAKQARDDAFNTAQRDKTKAFQDSQQKATEAFQSKQNAAQKTFEEGLKAANEATSKNFTEAQRRASVAEQLAAAQTTEERQKILKESAAQVAQQQAVSKLQLADRSFNPDQILKLAKQVTGANQGTVEGAKKISDAISAIQAEQQKQQEAADQAKRVAFEAQLRTDAKAFSDQQQANQAAFDQSRQDESKAFAESERQIADAWAELQRQVQAGWAESERQIQRLFEDENRSIQKAQKEEERALDLANAKEIQKILDSAKPKAPEARRMGGPVDAGQPYLVGEEGPELIYPSRAGYVATARETAAMMANFPSVGIAAIPSASINTRTLETQSARMIKLLGDANATLNKISRTKPAMPPPVQFPKEKPIFENWGGLPL